MQSIRSTFKILKERFHFLLRTYNKCAVELLRKQQCHRNRNGGITCAAHCFSTQQPSCSAARPNSKLIQYQRFGLNLYLRFFTNTVPFKGVKKLARNFVNDNIPRFVFCCTPWAYERKWYRQTCQRPNQEVDTEMISSVLTAPARKCCLISSHIRMSTVARTCVDDEPLHRGVLERHD